MTFKHVKFEDSPVMRSLEKLAHQKGLVKSEDVNKTASSKLDLTPTVNLTQNVLNLCAGLRTVNLHKMADDLEKNLMLYRQAQTLYETSKEKGEDLVDAAHPKGGHKLEGIDSKDAVFKTIIEKHLDTVNMVNKTPSGKLSNAKDILSAVKVVLADDDSSSSSALQGLVNQAQAKFNELVKTVSSPDQSPVSNRARLTTIAPIYKAWKNDAGGPTAETVARGLKSIDVARSRLVYADPTEVENLKKKYDDRTGTDEERFHYLSLTNSYSNWQKIEVLLNDLKSLLSNMQKTITGGDLGIIAKIDSQRKRLDKTFRSLLQDPGFTDQDRKDGNAEIDGYIKTLDQWKTVLQGVDEADKATIAAKYEKVLADLIPKINQLYSEIVGA